MRESRPPGSVRGVPSNGHPYRDVRRETAQRVKVKVLNRQKCSKPDWPLFKLFRMNFSASADNQVDAPLRLGDYRSRSGVVLPV